MRVDLFDFELPRDQIAQTPAMPRDAARLMHVTNGVTDRFVRDLPSLFEPGDALVVNDTKVIPTTKNHIIRSLLPPSKSQPPPKVAMMKVTEPQSLMCP